MKKWNVFLGVTWTEDTPTVKKGQFKTDSHMLSREKWHTLGRGRERIVIDENGKYWTYDVKYSVNPKAGFVIDIEVRKSTRQ
jgi:hypothetical protein